MTATISVTKSLTFLMDKLKYYSTLYRLSAKIHFSVTFQDVCNTRIFMFISY
jgi:hypothetical protein